MQRLFAVPENDGLMVTETSERGSVFDVGALFTIPGHDVNRAVFRHVLYSRMGDPALWRQVREAIEGESGLEESYRRELLAGPLEECCARGARTHHEGMLDAESGEVFREGLPPRPSAYNVVRRYQILKPERAEFFGAHLFDYSEFPSTDGFVVPLEFIVRFGMTSASSVYRKYQRMDEAERKAFERELGVTRPLAAWEFLERPVSDFTSKFEPEDRMVSKQEALAMCGLTGEQFVRAGKLAVLGAWAVRCLLGGMGLRLWDIKWEFARDGGDLVFVDTIDTDSVRATLFLESEGEVFVNHYNKQAVRDYFHLLHPDWLEGVAAAKARGREEGVAFTGILREGQESGDYPATPEVEEDFLAIQERKMDLIRECLLGERDGAATEEGLREAGLEEIGFYRERGVLEGFREMNGVSEKS